MLAVAFGHERGNGVPQTRHRSRRRWSRRAACAAVRAQNYRATRRAADAGCCAICFSRTSSAASIAAMIGTFSVPARRPPSCLPPWSSGVMWLAMRDFQKTHAARPAEFVRRAADVIAFAQSLDRHLADELHGVGEERHFVSLANRMDFAPRLDDAGLVVRGHHADEAGTLVGQFRREPVHVHHAVVRDGNQFRAFAEIMFRRIVDARMFDGGNPNFVLRAERLARNGA